MGRPALLTNARLCKICSEPAGFVGAKGGKLSPLPFERFRYRVCGFPFIANPFTEYEKIYTEEYYPGERRRSFRRLCVRSAEPRADCSQI
jgi:hypothetical protein